MKLDALDIRLLNAVQADNRTTAEALSRELPLSPSAITRRLQRLRAEGAIASEAAILSEELTSGRITALVQVQLDRHTPEGFQQLRQALLRRPEVQWCAEISGVFDLAMVVTTRSLTELNELVDMLSQTPAVRRSESSLVKRRWKATLAVPLDEKDATAGPA